MTINPTFKSVLRITADFALGVALFSFASFCVSAGHGPAFAGSLLNGHADPSNWLATVAFASDSNGIGWHPLTRDAAILLLALSFGTITALNMAIARHLQAVAKAEIRGPGHPQDVTNRISHSH